MQRVMEVKDTPHVEVNGITVKPLQLILAKIIVYRGFFFFLVSITQLRNGVFCWLYFCICRQYYSVEMSAILKGAEA